MKDIIHELKFRKTDQAREFLKKMTDRPYFKLSISQLSDKSEHSDISEDERNEVIKELLFRSSPQAKRFLKILMEKVDSQIT